MKTKEEIQELMMKEIFIKTGGRPENPRIAEICAEIAIEYASQNERDSMAALPVSDEPKCEAGCKRFAGGEVRHHKDCFYYQYSLSQHIDELERGSTPQSNWISVEQRLPEEEQVVLCYDGDTKIHYSIYQEKKFYRKIDKTYVDRVLRIFYPIVTHWMPLPKAPTQK